MSVHRTIKQINSELTYAKARLEQMYKGSVFTKGDMKILSPKYKVRIHELEDELETAIRRETSFFHLNTTTHARS